MPVVSKLTACRSTKHDEVTSSLSNAENDQPGDNFHHTTARMKVVGYRTILVAIGLRYIPSRSIC